MKKPPRTFLLVEAALDENDVPYLVADPAAPARRVGIERVPEPPQTPDHFAEHFRPRRHVVDATDARTLGHYLEAVKAGTLKLYGRCQAASAEEATRRLEAAPQAAAKASPSAPTPPAPAEQHHTPTPAPAGAAKE